MADTPFGVPAGDASLDGRAPSGAVVSTADRLRVMADWLDAHEGVNVSDITFYGLSTEMRDLSVNSPEELLAASRAIGGKWQKQASEASTVFSLEQEVIPGIKFRLIALREDVCVRVVTGQREVEKPDPSAPLVKVMEDVVEYHCEPLLGRSA